MASVIVVLGIITIASGACVRRLRQAVVGHPLGGPEERVAQVRGPDNSARTARDLVGISASRWDDPFRSPRRQHQPRAFEPVPVAGYIPTAGYNGRGPLHRPRSRNE